MQGIEGVICDMDGTLVDSEDLHLLAWNKLLERFGHQAPSPHWNNDCIGLPDVYALKKTLDLFPDMKSGGNLLGIKQEIFRELVREKGAALVYPGVKERLAQLQDSGAALGVGTNSIMQNTRATLTAAGLLDSFSVIVTSDMVANGKPHPDIYQAAARGLGLPPASCAVLEDSLAGLESARAAGCLVLGVANTWPAARLVPSDHVFESTTSALDWALSERLKHA